VTKADRCCSLGSGSMRRRWDERFAAEWDLLLCSAGSLSALLCEHARRAGRKALDVGALDQALLGDPIRSPID